MFHLYIYIPIYLVATLIPTYQYTIKRALGDGLGAQRSFIKNRLSFKKYVYSNKNVI